MDLSSNSGIPIPPQCIKKEHVNLVGFREEMNFGFPQLVVSITYDLKHDNDHVLKVLEREFWFFFFFLAGCK